MSGGTAIIGVAELHRRLKNAVHAACGVEWVEGEIASLKRAPSGHAYFQLKDEQQDAVLDCVMYKFYAARARRFLNEGARVQLSGRATIYAARGRLQYVAEALRPAGRGALLEALEQLKQRLAAEGLFDPARKRPLPADPRVVGVVTSRSGAALHDITSVAFRRANVTVVLSAALVQGEEAPRSLLRALDKLERYPGLDVVIIGRGGGSAEDLMAFNDERVVRRVASMQVPVVSAVGHEVDISLTDFVADVRAATPSQAAELVVPDQRSRLRALDDQTRHLGRAMRTRLIEARVEVDRLRTRIGDPRFYLAERQQLLDDTRLDLERSFGRRVRERRHELERLHRRVLSQHPTAVLSRAHAAMAPLNARLHGALRARLAGSRASLAERLTRIEALSPLAILGRGYAIARDLEGRVLTDASALSEGQHVTVRLAHGQFSAAVEARELEKELQGS
ncbi:MAG TPA: exodeoxyribonuclease VII large subunit [Polyangiaceae bacterium]|nr:exodeoxyribonuclease VII large subunit [Polyangiaceae bacterium]